MILVKFDDNYADEFDTEGFRIMSQSDLDQMLASAREMFIQAAGTEPYLGYRFKDDEVESYFGTNEQWSWASYEDFMQCLEFRNITNKGAWALTLFLGTKYGMFPYLEY